MTTLLEEMVDSGEFDRLVNAYKKWADDFEVFVYTKFNRSAMDEMKRCSKRALGFSSQFSELEPFDEIKHTYKVDKSVYEYLVADIPYEKYVKINEAYNLYIEVERLLKEAAKL